MILYGERERLSNCREDSTDVREGEIIKFPYPCPPASFVFRMEQKYNQPLLLYLISSQHIVFSAVFNICIYKKTYQIIKNNTYADQKFIRII